jgi:RNA polymerase sigma factor (sigma-70 family)
MLISTKEEWLMSTNNQTDIDVVKQIQSKSVEQCRPQVSLLYDKYKADVFRMTRSLFPRTEEGRKDADDLFADAWRVALERINEYDQDKAGTFGAWVKGIADYLKLTDNRKRKRMSNGVAELTYLTLQGEEEKHVRAKFGDDEDVDFISEHGHIYKEALVEALATLSEVERTILREWHRTYDKNNPGGPEHAANLIALADQFGIKPDSVRKYKLRAEQKIKKYFGLV